MSTELFANDDPMFLKHRPGVSPVVIHGYHITNGVCWSSLMPRRDTIWTVQVIRLPNVWTAHTYCVATVEVKSCQNHAKGVDPSRETLGKNVVLSLSFFIIPPFNMLSPSHAQWIKSVIASLTGADLSHVFKFSHSKRAFFSGSEQGLGGAARQSVGLWYPENFFYYILLWTFLSFLNPVIFMLAWRRGSVS